jgi:hypothetical protein
MNNVMLDLETMDTAATAAITAIGAVKFDLVTGEIGETFYRKISLQSSIDRGLTVSGSTIQWWLKQNEQARLEMAEEGISLPDALWEFALYIGAERSLEDDHDWVKSTAKIWGNGAAFDNAILAYAYSKVKLDLPWNFWNDRCYRTLKEVRPEVELVREGTHHNALDDAISQAKHLCRVVSYMRA